MSAKANKYMTIPLEKGIELYLALSILQLGVGIWMNSVWVVVLLVPAIARIRWRVIAFEERYLIGKFGQVYLDY